MFMLFVLIFDVWEMYYKNKNGGGGYMVKEWIYVLVIYLIGSCDFLKNNLLKQNDFDNKGVKCLL